MTNSSSEASRLILIVEDDRKTASLVAIYLEKDGFKTVHASDGRTALERVKRHPPDFIILDLMLPGVNGWDLCREFRRKSDVPILILTAKDEEFHRVLGLSLGADDYMVKPFSPRELVARVKAIFRRVGSSTSHSEHRLSRQDLVLDSERRRVTRSGRPVDLTPSEYKILEALMTAPGRVFLRDELLNRLYAQADAVVDRVIDVHIGNLRKKIEEDPSNPRHIRTVRGLGYRFAEEDE